MMQDSVQGPDAHAMRRVPNSRLAEYDVTGSGSNGDRIIAVIDHAVFDQNVGPAGAKTICIEGKPRAVGVGIDDCVSHGNVIAGQCEISPNGLQRLPMLGVA